MTSINNYWIRWITSKNNHSISEWIIIEYGEGLQIWKWIRWMTSIHYHWIWWMTLQNKHGHGESLEEMNS